MPDTYDTLLPLAFHALNIMITVLHLHWSSTSSGCTLFVFVNTSSMIDHVIGLNSYSRGFWRCRISNHVASVALRERGLDLSEILTRKKEGLWYWLSLTLQKKKRGDVKHMVYNITNFSCHFPDFLHKMTCFFF